MDASNQRIRLFTKATHTTAAHYNNTIFVVMMSDDSHIWSFTASTVHASTLKLADYTNKLMNSKFN